MLQSRNGQSTLEYLLLFTAVVVALIFFVAVTNSPYQTRLNETYDLGTNALFETSNTFYNSF